MPRTHAEMLDDVRVGIVDYVKFRKRIGRPLTFQEALRGHRQVIADAFADTPDDTDLRDRLVFLDELCVQEGIA